MAEAPKKRRTFRKFTFRDIAMILSGTRTYNPNLAVIPAEQQRRKYQEEFQRMLPGGQCSRRVRILNDARSGKKVVVQCAHGQGDTQVHYCQNAFISKSEAALEKIVELSKLVLG